MDKERAIERLRKEAASNPVAHDVFENFSKRNRAWDSVALRPLWVDMNPDKGKPGKRYPIGDIAKVLGLIASSGLGKGVAGDNGRTVKVTHLAIDLRELGAAVIGDSKNLKKYLGERKERAFESVAKTVQEAPSNVKVFPYRAAGSLSISLTINGKLVTLPLPDGLSSSELTALIERLKKADDDSK